VQKWLNQSIYHLGCGLGWAEGSTMSIIFANWRQCAQCALCQITFTTCHLWTRPIRQSHRQTAKRFEPSTVLWAFHTIQPSGFVSFLSQATAKPICFTGSILCNFLLTCDHPAVSQSTRLMHATFLRCSKFKRRLSSDAQDTILTSVLGV